MNAAFQGSFFTSAPPALATNKPASVASGSETLDHPEIAPTRAFAHTSVACA